MTRRTILRTMIGGAIAAPYPCYLEPRWLEVTQCRALLTTSAISKPVRILHLADFHASFFVPMSMIEHAVTLGLEQKPDIVCLTGDFITDRDAIDSREYVRILRRLSASAPVFAVLGNHDGGLWARDHLGFADHRAVERLLEDSHITLLHNRPERIQVRNETLSLVGVADLWSDEIDAVRAFSGVDPRSPIVLLAHNPDTKDVLAYPWNLMLSGHTHGGQVIVPFDGPRFAPVEDKRYVAGLKPWGTRQIHVTRGVGNVGGVRFRCRPEVSLVLVG